MENGRNGAKGIAVMRLYSVSFTYSVPLRPKVTPVGPTTSAEEFSCSGKPEPMTVVEMR